MQKKFLILAAASVFLIQFYGCNKTEKKEEPKPAAAAAQPAQTSVQPQAPIVPEVKGTVVAMVDGFPITLESLNEEIERYNGMVEEKPELKIDTKEKKIAYLKTEMSRRILLYQEAQRRGLDKNPDVLKGLEETKQQLLVMQLAKDELSKVKVTSAAIEEYYNTYQEQFKEPEERHVREIVVVTEAEAKAALAKLLLGEEEFASLATRISKADSAAKGGDLGFIKPGDTNSEEFDRVAFSEAIEVGQVSQIFKGPKGYYIIKLEAKKGGKQRTLPEIYDNLEEGLNALERQKRLEDLVKSLSKNAKIEIKESEIK